MSLVLDEKTNFYSRSCSTERSKLEDDLIKYYGFEVSYTKGNRNGDIQSAVFPSGMAAISALFSVIPKGTYVLGNELYCDTRRTALYHIAPQDDRMNEEKKQLLRHDDLIEVDVTDIKAIVELFKEKGRFIKLFFIESCSNPSGQVFDFSFLPELRKLAPDCIFCVDNTWLSGCSFNPFLHGADVIIESMTKYISGGECIGGMMVGKKDVLFPVLDWIRKNGQFVGSDHCELFSKGLETADKRLTYVSEVTESVIKFLLLQKSVTKISHPRLQTHPSYGLAEKWFKYTPGIIWFHVATKETRKQAVKRLNEIGLKYATSYGGPESRIDPWPEMGGSNLYGAVDGEQIVPGIWVRLSVGYKSADQDVMAALYKFTNNVPKK